MVNGKRLFKRSWRVALTGLIAAFVVAALIAQTAPHYHSDCCYPIQPEKMAKLSPSIRQQLTAEHCLIPQNSYKFDDPQPNNAIHGPWAAKGQDDWAVLCIMPEELSARIFWGGKTKCDDKIVIARFRPGDGHWDDPDTILWPAPPATIRAYNRAFSRHKLPALDHSGLQIGGEEASTIYYCLDGNWTRFNGND
jgi:hypothetical protein